MIESQLACHRAHDYPHLVERWRTVAAKTGLAMRRFATAPEFPLYVLRSRSLPREGTIYISAGIHGDEPAGTEALIAWAERNTRLLRRHPFLIVPCINPWGIVNNSRADYAGRDLNRHFQDDSIPEIAALRRVIGRRRYSLVLTLHEDYDGLGIYIYEIPGSGPPWGERLLRAAAVSVPIEIRRMVEGRECVDGLVRRPIDMEVFKEMGVPEAIYFYMRKCPRVFTIETPSEYGLDRRVNAQLAVIDEAIRLTLAEKKKSR